MTEPHLFLVAMSLLGGTVVGSVLALRHLDQRRRDARRRAFVVTFPRSVTAEQVAAFARTLVGLAAPRVGVLGHDTAVFEVIGRREGITHRLRLPKSSADYFAAQLRAAVPGIAITRLEAADPLAKLPTVTAARELRLTNTERALSVEDPAAVSRTVLAACTNLNGPELVVWQLVTSGGTPNGPTRGVTWTELVRRLFTGQAPADTTLRTRQRKDAGGVTGAVLRVGAVAGSDTRAARLVARLVRAAASVSAVRVRLVPRRLPRLVVRPRLLRGASPLIESPAPLSVPELVALVGWPIGAPAIPGLVLGRSPQLVTSPLVPRGGRVLGDATVGGKRPVAQSRRGALEHSLYLAPTGTGKTWLAAQVALADRPLQPLRDVRPNLDVIAGGEELNDLAATLIARGDGVLVVDPKGGLVRAILERLPEEAIARTILVDPTDEARPVPLPLLTPEQGGIPELAADTLVGLLRHRYRDLGPRSSDILSSSLYALARVPNATLLDLLPLWSSPAFRASVVVRVQDDPVLSSFFGWFEGLAATERNFVLAAPMNKIRPLLQRPLVRNVVAAPRATFTLAGALARRQVVLVSLPEGVIGGEATSLLGQVVVARLWAAVQGRGRLGERSRRPFFVTLDEAPRLIDQPTDLGDMLARSREYGVGITLIGQSLSQFPSALREIALNSARTKVAFGSSAADARRLAPEFGPAVSADMLTGLSAFEAIGAVSVGGAVSQPFTFRTRPLGPKIPGRAAAVRAASRERWGIDRAEIEASFSRRQTPPDAPTGPVGRRVER